jgi:hypothetical protein
MALEYVMVLPCYQGIVPNWTTRNVEIDAPTTLGELVSLYGTPCMVIKANTYTPVILVGYSSLIAAARADFASNHGFLEHGSSVEPVWLFRPDPDICIGSSDVNAGPWLGFTTLDRYRDQ